MQRTYRTPKGTELPLLNLRGREYLEVKYRLVWFREEHPDWAIETELLSVTPDSAYARAVIKDNEGRIIATSHKFETKRGFPDFIEKSETGAIGRALALIGFGTQFCADELDEGERIVDAPVEKMGVSANEPWPEDYLASRASNEAETGRGAAQDLREADAGGSDAVIPSQTPINDPGDYRITFGKKYKGLKLRDIPRGELEGYIEWLEENTSKKGLPLSEEARFLKVAVERFLQSSGAKGEAGAKSKAAPRKTEAATEGAKH